MLQIRLLPIPNQTFTVTIDGAIWDIVIRKAVNCMFADIKRDNETVILGQRILPNQAIIPYKYLSMYGNFAIITVNEEYPNYERFDLDHVLVYLTPQELGLDD